MRARAVLIIIALAALVAGLGSAASSQTTQASKTIELPIDDVGQVGAYRAAELAPESLAPGTGPRVHSPPEGNIFGEPQLERIKELATWSTRPVRGEVLRAQRRAGAPAAVQIQRSYDGLNQSTATTSPGWAHFPPDTMLAVSSSSLVHATNGGIMVAARDGSKTVKASPNGFFGVGGTADPQNLLFDPKLAYDRRVDRFFVVYLFKTNQPKRSFMYVAVSRHGAPSTLADEDWCKYKIRGRVGSAWADYQGLGFDRDFVVLTTNNFRFSGGYSNAFIWAIDKLALVDNVDACPKLRFTRFKASDDSEGWPSFTIQPAEHLDNTGPGGLFMLSTQPLTFAERVLLWRVENKSSSRAVKPRVTMTELVTSEYMPPPNADQKGGDTLLESGDMRVTQTVFRDGILYAVHALTCAQGAAPNESCIRILEIAPTDDMVGSTLESEKTFGAGRNKHVFWPGIAVNSRGTIVTSFLLSGTRKFLSTGFVEKATGNAKPGRLRTLAAGNRHSICGTATRNRTGDYVGAQVDPIDDLSFVIAGQYADEAVDTFVTDCRWNVRIGELR